MTKIAYVTTGKSAQLISYWDYAHYVDQFIYADDLPSFDLEQFGAVILSCGCPSDRILPYKKQLNDYVRSGGFLIIFTLDKADQLLDVVNIECVDSRTKDWLWWTKPGGKIELYVPDQINHSFYDYVKPEHLHWHWHGAIKGNHNGTTLLAVEDRDEAIIVDFKDLEGGGRVFITTLDPHNHNGQRFMPVTTKLLGQFYPWINNEFGIDRNQIEPFKVAYLQTTGINSEDTPPYLSRTFEGTGGQIEYFGARPIPDEVWDCDIIYMPSISDQIYMQKYTDRMMDYIRNGGQLILNIEVAVCWLPFLKPFQTVPPVPYTNLKVRVENDPFEFFKNMPEDFDGWEGIIGQYARGFTPLPEYAMGLTSIGAAHANHSADYIWQYPTIDGSGGKVFVHNGDNMIRYPDHGEHQECLVRDICVGLMKYRRAVVPFAAAP
ncbi:hypothetical protein [Paenibacillus sp. OV219]|uniref:hypothetical protein n=1 Tax=Paenibacillus sp. OV219 TaxID=1884377 RepID=UPI0008B231CC|nr:hypothetical protein [Paenibacillus sp. OV219]SEN28622.1 hypothetical protein SAMN05518847_102593 [Paenibacillus sp. OV219]